MLSDLNGVSLHVALQEALSLSSIVLGQTLFSKASQTPEDNPATHSAPVMWEGRILQFMGGLVSRKTPRAQFPRACFFEASAELRAATRLRVPPELDQAVWFCAVCSCFWL